MTGPEAVRTCERLFSGESAKEGRVLKPGRIAVGTSLAVEAIVYFFRAPRSYTGEDVVELHVRSNRCATEAIVESLLKAGLRTAGAGEFTARAYLNGKMDLTQAEAVNEMIVSSNAYQLEAAERLLGGRLSERTGEVRSAIMDCLSLIEAGLDFSEEDIELASRPQMVERLGQTAEILEQLLAGSIGYESLMELPAVGIAGQPNAGKSSLLNRLLGRERSIVSDSRKTTRDVLSGTLELTHSRCVLFDCAGLMIEPEGILDELAQRAATEALRSSSVVVFCVDVSKSEWSADISIRRLFDPEALIGAATKVDLLGEEVAANRLARLRDLFGVEFLATSAKTGAGTAGLRERIDGAITGLSAGPNQAGRRGLRFSETSQDLVALTARHRQGVTEAIENMREAGSEVDSGNDEVAAMLMRGAYEAISEIEQQPVDEQILERIFSSFCIGK